MASEKTLGKYDAISEAALRTALALHPGAVGALVMVVGDPASTGFSLSTTDPELAGMVPALLRDFADAIEEARGRGNG
jgi:hypothetical protein